MDSIIECVPNFSEGRSSEVIGAISTAIESTEGCSLLDVDPGRSTNRYIICISVHVDFYFIATRAP